MIHPLPLTLGGQVPAAVQLVGVRIPAYHHYVIRSAECWWCVL